MNNDDNLPNTDNKILAFVLCIIALVLVACSASTSLLKTSLDEQPPKMISAFFGLDNALDARRYKDADGMPVTFSRRLQDTDADVDHTAFTVVTASGARLQPKRATTRPANAMVKRHTVLLIGEFGNDPEDPPVKVGMTGDLALSGGENARGLSIGVTPLADGRLWHYLIQFPLVRSMVITRRGPSKLWWYGMVVLL